MSEQPQTVGGPQGDPPRLDGHTPEDWRRILADREAARR